MANPKIRIKNGMGGSRCGRNRSEKTAGLKHSSKKARRKVGQKEIQKMLYEIAAYGKRII